MLLDGDGIVFQEGYLKDGGAGGSSAAHDLHNTVRRYMDDMIDDSRNWQIMVMMFANLDGLSRKLAHIGMIQHPGVLNEFASSFSLSQPMFNFIDVGRGKERADHKLKGQS